MKFTAPLAPWHERYRQEFFGDESFEVAEALVPAEECFVFAASAGSSSACGSRTVLPWR